MDLRDAGETQPHRRLARARLLMYFVPYNVHAVLTKNAQEHETCWKVYNVMLKYFTNNIKKFSHMFYNQVSRIGFYIYHHYHVWNVCIYPYT